jgi:hypothetical protein
MPMRIESLPGQKREDAELFLRQLQAAITVVGGDMDEEKILRMPFGNLLAMLIGNDIKLHVSVKAEFSS